MKVSVHLFARARELAGADTVAIHLPEGSTVRDLRRALAEAHPALTRLLEHSALAVNNDFADDLRMVPVNAEVALLPPVSGG